MTLTTAELQAISECIDEADESWAGAYDRDDEEEAQTHQNRRRTISHARNGLHEVLKAREEVAGLIPDLARDDIEPGELRDLAEIAINAIWDGGAS